jgi:hypothetical protein
MAAGIPGAINRTWAATVEAQVYDNANTFSSYGVPAKIVSGLLRPVASGDAASVVYGFLVRPYPAHSTNDPIGTSTPPTLGIANVMVRGYMTVQLNNTTAATKNGQVYVRVASAATGKPIGGIEAGADSGNCVAITGAFFMGAADASGNVEIRYNI